MEGLLQRQQIIAEAIKKISVNIKKDSASRKTSEYIQQRLSSLRQHWNEFEENHKELTKAEDKSNEYFTSNAYQEVKDLFQGTCDVLQLLKPVVIEEKKDDGSKTAEKGILSKTDELIGQQRTNFRAFSRVVKNIDIAEISEKWEIEDKLKLLQSRWNTIDELHWQIDNLLIGSEVDYEQDYAQHESIFETTKKALNRKLNAATHQNQKVPHMEIPTFSGNYSQWPTFMDLYSEIIHKNTMLSKSQKMQHLKGKLKGEAERLVQHLNISADNYDTCWEILTHRYNNTQLLFTKQMQTFMSQPAIQKHNSYEIKRLHDTSLETIHAIHNLGVDTTTWDPILVHILSEKMDTELYTDYMEARKTPRQLPSFDELIGFLEGKFTALETLNKKNKVAQPAKQNSDTSQGKEFSLKALRGDGNPSNFNKKSYLSKINNASADIQYDCPVCKLDHKLMNCKTFLTMLPEAKLKTIAQLDICKNCLFCHNSKQCTSTKRCKLCNQAHHTKLHETVLMNDNDGNMTTSANSTPKFTPPPAPTVSSQQKSNHVAGNCNEILLATAELNIMAADGNYVQLRCLIDQGSQTNLITEAAAQRLGLKRRKQDATISGIGVSSNHCNGVVQLACKSVSGDYEFTTEALVMAKMLSNLPNYTFEKQQWSHLQNISLADPDYNISRPIDILLDAGVYAEILLDGILRGPSNAPIAQQTKLGWLLLGNVKTFNCLAVLNNVEDISRFWEMEEITNTSSRTMTTDEEYCESLYQSTTTRLPDGRYEVKIPMKQDFEKKLGSSKPQAVAQFRQLEKRLAKNEKLAEGYKEFIDEYVQLGHMRECTIPKEPSCYLPHHGVIKLDSTTTKLRVVFNGSVKTKSGHSLNELMECGPRLQQDLQLLLLRWRGFQYVYTADIEKFYRQIIIHEDDQHLQKIIWRDSSDSELKEYQLCTVTYGTKAAPFLAMRTIKQLIKDEGKHFPLAAEVLNNQLYVDDLLGGSNDITEARITQEQLVQMLNRGGFNLRKWASNETKLLAHLPQHLISQNMLDLKHAETNKALGVTWNPQTDQLTFKQINSDGRNDVITKRSLLSDLSKIYDPLGWLSPVTMKAKLLFQQIWSLGTTWDDPLPDNIQKEWKAFKEDLPTVQSITLPRSMGNTQKPIELHGFSDASEKGFSGVIYCKSTDSKGQQNIKLLAGKTKLAPLKTHISLPRLELCGALLLARLMKKTIDSLNKQTVTFTIHGWTDSMVVLGWLQGDVSRWKTFVANRVTQIVSIMPSASWSHVKSDDNAADCASRGLSPAQLPTHSLWWEGPSWLKQPTMPKQQKAYDSPTEERKAKQVCVSHISSPIIEELLTKHSSMTRVARTLSWISRFINNCRDKATRTTSYNLTALEIECAYSIIIKVVQQKHFVEEISQLQKQDRVHSKSRILNLNPFLDERGILRVGGRLQQSSLNDLQKHPVILPQNHKLSQLLIDQAHKITLHGGAKLTLAHLRNRYWILGGMRTVKGRLIQCVKCHRFKTAKSNQMMADLPKPRVTPSRPFTHTGVDFTGQVEVKANKGRGIKTTKGYIAVFVCLATKAVHLELVSDLSSAAFLAALKRLCARRGTPKSIYSDNGTNFVGAAKILMKEHVEALKYYINPEFMESIAEQGIEWHFNAPAWPTAGGLWEAAVKSMKTHLKRVLGEQKLTYEEFSTLLAQVEACLNSRPLVSLSDDVDDLQCLTPGHFLVGGPILSGPLSPDQEIRSIRNRWQLTERMHRDFWKRWSTEYLQTLQTRSKWYHPSKNLEVGDIVLIKEDNIPPARWLLGRVTETHPGRDGYVRVVSLKTKNNILKRPITKLSRLPIDTIKTTGGRMQRSDDVTLISSGSSGGEAG